MRGLLWAIAPVILSCVVQSYDGQMVKRLVRIVEDRPRAEHRSTVRAPTDSGLARAEQCNFGPGYEIRLTAPSTGSVATSVGGFNAFFIQEGDKLDYAVSWLDKRANFVVDLFESHTHWSTLHDKRIVDAEGRSNGYFMKAGLGGAVRMTRLLDLSHARGTHVTDLIFRAAPGPYRTVAVVVHYVRLHRAGGGIMEFVSWVSGVPQLKLLQNQGAAAAFCEKGFTLQIDASCRSLLDESGATYDGQSVVPLVFGYGVVCEIAAQLTGSGLLTIESVRAGLQHMRMQSLPTLTDTVVPVVHELSGEVRITAFPVSFMVATPDLASCCSPLLEDIYNDTRLILDLRYQWVPPAASRSPATQHAQKEVLNMPVAVSCYSLKMKNRDQVTSQEPDINEQPDFCEDPDHDDLSEVVGTATVGPVLDMP
ncbi:hypothetical protein DIPPA_02093 [Diplonema papillatum]|nr:hypothetical protein DIPPA_02093 [Diplonema papillatum]